MQHPGNRRREGAGRCAIYTFFFFQLVLFEASKPRIVAVGRDEIPMRWK